MGMGLNILHQSTQAIIERHDHSKVCYYEKPVCLRVTPCAAAGYHDFGLHQAVM